MLKNILKMMAAVVAVISFASCASMKETAPVVGLTSISVKTDDITANLDLANAKRVEATVTMSSTFGVFKSYSDRALLENSLHGKHYKKMESRALCKAKKEAGVDVILEPEFVVEKHRWFLNLFTTKKVTVKGWGVNLKGFK